jgi:hypothetical protein
VRGKGVVEMRKVVMMEKEAESKETMTKERKMKSRGSCNMSHNLMSISSNHTSQISDPTEMF